MLNVKDAWVARQAGIVKYKNLRTGEFWWEDEIGKKNDRSVS